MAYDDEVLIMRFYRSGVPVSARELLADMVIPAIREHPKFSVQGANNGCIALDNLGNRLTFEIMVVTRKET